MFNFWLETTAKRVFHFAERIRGKRRKEEKREMVKNFGKRHNGIK